MKTKMKVLVGLLMTVMFGSIVSAQITVSPAVDFYSNYIWRGTKFATGPVAQPSVTLKTGGLTVGVWGSFDALGYTEADPYVSFSFPFGLSLGVTDYYYPTHASVDTIFGNTTWMGSDISDFKEASTFHALELNAGYSIIGFSVSANYIFNKAGGAATMGGDKYFELGYTFPVASLFVGAGDGWHTSDTKFAVCNVGVKSTKEIKVTETFIIPVTGLIVFNPEKKQMSLVVGLSF